VSLGIHGPFFFQRIDMVWKMILIIYFSKDSEQGLGGEFLTIISGVAGGVAGVVGLYINSTRMCFMRKVELR
jgi:hypothetical protein